MIYWVILKISRSFLQTNYAIWTYNIFGNFSFWSFYYICNGNNTEMKICKLITNFWLSVHGQEREGHACFTIISFVHNELMTWTQSLFGNSRSVKEKWLHFLFILSGVIFSKCSLYHHFLRFLSTSLHTLYSTKKIIFIILLVFTFSENIL